MAKKCYIMRGPAGSGKDTWIKLYLSEDKIKAIVTMCSADLYHMVGVEYVYKKENAAKAHDWCLLKFIDAIRSGAGCVVVNNTNIKVFEIAPYYRIAEAFGYDVEIVHVLADPEACKARNVHGVPPETVDAMFNGIEPLPLWWKRQYVISL